MILIRDATFRADLVIFWYKCYDVLNDTI